MVKVILNALPPARVDTPSAALSGLKAFLAYHNIETTIIYWNILLDGLLPAFERNTDAIHFELLPYMYLISDTYQDEINKSKINAIMKAELPIYDILNNNSDYLIKTRGILDAAVLREFSKYSNNGPLLFGISCKYEQWIAGVVLARYIKDRFPHAKIVVGGLRSRDKAESVMKVCDDFDFAIWGEGEYPLLELCRTIDNQRGSFDSVPRLVFRKEGSIRFSDKDVSQFYDLNSRIFPEYDDYFNYLEVSHKRGIAVILPLESSRGCTWNVCRFCVYADGYETRKKDPGVLKDEINYLLDKYGTRYFAFMDNDIVANDHKRLERILDDLISIKQDKNIHLIAEVIPKDFTAAIMKKLSRAGLNRIHFGYESLSDRLLTKMRKRTNFSDNICFVKFAHKYKVKLPSANIICGTIGEEDYDVLESIDNLHFLRFYFDKNLFAHNLIPLRIAKHSDFYNMIDHDALIKWDDNTVFHLLPHKMMEGIDRFSLFDFSARSNLLWDMFLKINTFYYDHNYSYTISLENDAVLYREFFDGELLIERAISRLEYRILQETNSNILDLGDLLNTLRPESDIGIDEKSVCITLSRLKEKHLVYFNDNYRSIISIVHIDQIDGLPASGIELK
ncbi:MAG: hypothetical protein C0392_07415 [Syntrophus sp. (in: bacteria)]|nr:hypothetical protein [Syntrophus sp. (in: bacteria)]